MSICLKSLNLKCRWIFLILANKRYTKIFWNRLSIRGHFKRIKTNIINVTFATYVISHIMRPTINEIPNAYICNALDSPSKLYLLQLVKAFKHIRLTRTHKSANLFVEVNQKHLRFLRTSHSYSFLTFYCVAISFSLVPWPFRLYCKNDKLCRMNKRIKQHTFCIILIKLCMTT